MRCAHRPSRNRIASAASLSYCAVGHLRTPDSSDEDGGIPVVVEAPDADPKAAGTTGTTEQEKQAIAIDLAQWQSQAEAQITATMQA